MVIRLFCFALLIPLCLSAQEEADLITRSYVIGQVPIFHYTNLMHRSGGGGGGKGEDPFGGGDPFGYSPPATPPKESTLPWARRTANPEFLKEYVAYHLGVTFPEGAWIRYQRGGHVLHMHNTSDNHEILQLGLVSNQLLATQVEITLRLLAFPEKDIDARERKSPGPLTDADWLELWRKGEGETLAVQSVKTLNGVNAILECVEEIIYPTEMDSFELDDIVIGGDSPQLPEIQQIIYGGFETREVGVILNVTPTVSADQNTLNLVLLPEKAGLKGDNALLPDDAKPAAPVFHSLNITTSLVIQNGATLVLGQSTDIPSGQRLVLLVNARLITFDGKAVKVPFVIPPAALSGEEQP